MSLEKDLKKPVKKLLRAVFPWLEYQKVKRYDDFDDDLDVDEDELKELKKPIKKVFGVEIRKRELADCVDVDDLITLIADAIKEERRQEEETLKRNHPVFMLFALLAKIAAVDGPINAKETSFLEQFMNEYFNLNKSQKATLGAHWQSEGNNGQGDFHSLLSTFAHHPDNDQQWLQHVIFGFFALANCDSIINIKEEKLLKAAFAQLSPQSDYQTFRAEYFPDPKQYYTVLGCESSVTDEELKRTYRQLIADLHPDKLQSKGVSSEIMKLALQRSQQVTEAYQMIRKLREG